MTELHEEAGSDDRTVNHGELTENAAGTAGYRHGLHRRTWELELLISGAIVVALFKLPTVVDGLFDQLTPHTSRDLFQVPFLLYYMAKLALTPMVLILILHILLRGLWVGMVGINALFPDGIKWHKLDLGPLQRPFYQAKASPRRLEQNVDRICSALFSVLFIILSFVAAMAFWGLFSMTVTVLLKAFVVSGTEIKDLTLKVFWTIGFLVFTPAIFVALIDQLAKKWPQILERAPRLQRLCTAVLRFFYWVYLGFLWYPPSALLTSNLTRSKLRWWQGVLASLPIGVIAPLVVVLPLLGPRLMSSVNSYIYAPARAQESGMSAAYYDSLRTSDAAITVPRIQSDIVSEPYVRLYLPYDARRDNLRLAEVCSDLDPFRGDGNLVAAMRRAPSTVKERTAALACFAKLWTVTLNGKTLNDLQLLFADDPQSGGRGVVVYLPTEDLPKGRNLLQVSKVTTEEERSEKLHNPEKFQYFIPFWI
jgi:hypothetical protein